MREYSCLTEWSKNSMNASRLIEGRRVKLNGHLQEVFVENFCIELAEIKSPIARELYVLAKASQLIHLRIDEYVTLIGAEMTGHYGVGCCLKAASPTISRLPNERVDSSETSSRGRSPRDGPP
jgi:hypothetical protein